MIQCGEFEVPINAAATSSQELQIQEPHWKPIFARVPLIPKFASEVATIDCERRNQSSSLHRRLTKPRRFNGEVEASFGVSPHPGGIFLPKARPAGPNLIFAILAASSRMSESKNHCQAQDFSGVWGLGFDICIASGRRLGSERHSVIGLRPASIAIRRGSRKGGRASFSPSLSIGSSVAKPGPSVAISNRMPLGSRKYRLRK